MQYLSSIIEENKKREAKRNRGNRLIESYRGTGDKGEKEKQEEILLKRIYNVAQREFLIYFYDSSAVIGRFSSK